MNHLDNGIQLNIYEWHDFITMLTSFWTVGQWTLILEECGDRLLTLNKYTISLVYSFSNEHSNAHGEQFIRYHMRKGYSHDTYAEIQTTPNGLEMKASHSNIFE